MIPSICILSADEANRRTKDNIEKCQTGELAEIFEKIYSAVENGNFSISDDGTLHYETSKRLEQLGYKVDRNAKYNEPYWIISWK